MSITLDLSRFSKRAIKSLDYAITKKAMKTYGETAIEQIVKRVRRGYGLEQNGAPLSRLAPLAKATKAYRKRYKHLLSEHTSVGKSNLTFSGAMLDSMMVLSLAIGRVTIGPSKRLKHKGTKLTHWQLAKIHQEVGVGAHRVKRPFLFVGVNEEKIIQRLFRNTLRQGIFKTKTQGV
jgi:hypothetical protein